MIQYHVFTNNQDEWYDDLNKAKKLYKEWLVEYGTARLYKEIYKGDFELDNMVDEECLLTQGEWPQ